MMAPRSAFRPARSALAVRTLTRALALAFATAASAGAQQEFTTQILIVTPLEARPMSLGARAADILRSRVDGSVSGRELKVVSGGELSMLLARSGIRLDDLSPDLRMQIADEFRADEQLFGRVERVGDRVRVHAELVLTRNRRLRQPLGVNEAATVDAATRPLADELVAARAQLVPQRRCENLLREGDPVAAAAAAREGVDAYPRATLARACLVEALLASQAPADSLARVAEQILAIDSASAIGLERAAAAYDVLGRHGEAGALWVRLFATDTADAALAERVITGLSSHGNAALARPIAASALAQHASRASLQRLNWLVLLALGEWGAAVAAGEQLPLVDSLVQQDPQYYARMSAAYAADSQPLRAVEYAARGAARFPDDASLYVAYAQLIDAERSRALSRGLVRFPNDGALAVLQSRALREAGREAEAVEALERAAELDGSLSGVQLSLADAYLERGQADSAYRMLERALAAGESPDDVARFALARGNARFRAAGSSGTRAEYTVALRLITLADSLAPSPQSTFLSGVTALAVAQSAAREGVEAQSCDLAQLAARSLEQARTALPAGESIAQEAVTQYLSAVGELAPYVDRQRQAFCDGG